MKKITFQNLWPWINSNELMNQNCAKLGFKKRRGVLCFSKFLWRQPQNCENVTLVTHRKSISGVCWRFFGCSTPSKRGVLVHKNLLASCPIERYHHSVESSECLVTVELTPHTYISLRKTLFYSSCLLPTVTVTPSDSNYVNRSAPLKNFSWIVFTINEFVDRIRNFKSNAS